MKNLKSLISVFLALVLLVSNLPIYVHAEASDENDVQTLIEQLPDVVDPMGTEYYFYNQLSDIEKVIYWKISEATWETPEIVIANPSAYKTDLNHAAGRALSALIADNPEYHMYWGRYTSGAPNSDCFTLALSKENISSAYLIRKAESKIDEIVATVGQEGDTYTRFRELVNWSA